MPTQNESNCDKLLKGLQRSPRIVTDANAMNRPHVFTAADVSCLVIPDGCLGLPRAPYACRPSSLSDFRFSKS